MPKIDVSQNLLMEYIGEKLDMAQLESLLPVAKAELDGIDEDNHVLKIELNDTNRPDLWSLAGIARQLKTYLSGEPGAYDCFSTAIHTIDSGNREIHVDPAMEPIRPYIAAFAAFGNPVNDLFLQTLIQSQEKLCDHYGRNRQTVAMGIYAGDRIEYPVRYRGADPDQTAFIPLDGECEMSLRNILKSHPKGIEYGHIISDYVVFPYLEDNRGNCLSLPPIINSNDCGAVEVGQRHLFVELTGIEINTVLTATAIIACDLADAGYEILPVKIIYPYDTPYGKKMVTPYYFQKQCSVKIEDACKVLGDTLFAEDIIGCLKKMGHNPAVEDGIVSIHPPAYRNDFMHGVDIIEDIMISRGIDCFNPILPDDATIGRVTPTETLSRNVRDIMIGLGYQEMIYNYLGSRSDLIEKMGIADDAVIEIANPKSLRYQMVRNSIIPNLLNSEAVSANALYPHKIFEIGSVAIKEIKDIPMTTTKHHVGMLMANTVAGFNEIHSHVSALLYYLNIDFTLKAIEDNRFINGRCAGIYLNNHLCGIMGEIHPKVLENCQIEMPCAAAEIDLSAFNSPSKGH